jgi:predicted MarR family transcription regulator
METSIKQMCSRVNSGHRTILARLADGPLAAGDTTASPNRNDIRGLITCLGTLRKWGCVTTTRTGIREYTDEITDRGRDLLEALR